MPKLEWSGYVYTEIEREHLSIKYAWKIRNHVTANNVDKLTKKYGTCTWYEI